MAKTTIKERGSIIVISMLAMVALVSLGGLSTLAVRGGLTSSGHDRFRSMALYAAESGAAAAVDYLRARVDADPLVGWSAFLDQSDPNIPFVITDIPGNQVQPGNNLFSADFPVWYSVGILNNLDDPRRSSFQDGDHRIIVRSTGYGPGGTIAQIEVEVKAPGPFGGQKAACAYGQGGMCADGSGNDVGAGQLSTTGSNSDVNLFPAGP